MEAGAALDLIPSASIRLRRLQKALPDSVLRLTPFAQGGPIQQMRRDDLALMKACAKGSPDAWHFSKLPGLSSAAWRKGEALRLVHLAVADADGGSLRRQLGSKRCATSGFPLSTCWLPAPKCSSRDWARRVRSPGHAPLRPSQALCPGLKYRCLGSPGSQLSWNLHLRMPSPHAAAGAINLLPALPSVCGSMTLARTPGSPAHSGRLLHSCSCLG